MRYGAIVLLGALVAAWYLARRPRVPRRGSGRRPGGGRGSLPWSRWSWARRKAPEPDLGLLLTEVASRLRAGAPTDVAWATALRRAGLHTTGDGAAPPEPGVPAPVAELLHRPTRDPAVRASLRAVVAACRLTHEVGAPLAQVLDRCAQSVTEAREAHDARRVAMAAPAATARILAVLPVFGLLLGVGLGSDPVAVALDGGWGTLSTVLGLLLALAGRWWSTALVTAARSPGGTGGSPGRRAAPVEVGSGNSSDASPRRWAW